MNFNLTGNDCAAARQDLHRRFNRCANDSDSSADFAARWESDVSIHLPLSVRVLHDVANPVINPLAVDAARPRGRIWRTHEAYQSSTSERKTLLLMTGYSYEQLALSITMHVTAFRCRNVIPVTTRDAWDKSGHGEEIRRLWETLRTCWGELPEWTQFFRGDEVRLVDEDKPSHVFQQLRGWLRPQPSARAALAVDATGGTKPMDSGATAFAAYYAVPAYYLHTTSYHATLRRPDPSSAKYSLLDSPSATFSEAARRTALAAFANRNFALADQLLAALKADIRKDGEFGDYFDDVDRGNVDAAISSVRQSLDWMTIGYRDHAATSDPDEESIRRTQDTSARATTSLACRPIETFLARCDRDGTDPRDTIRRLRANSDRTDGWRLLMQYFVSEYYRLRYLMNWPPESRQTSLAADAASERDTTPSAPSTPSAPNPPIAPQNVREVVAFGYGLAESILDSILELPVVRRRLCVAKIDIAGRAVAKETVAKRDGTLTGMRGTLERQSVPYTDTKLRTLLLQIGWIAPRTDFLHLAHSEKARLLCKGRADFKSVRAAPQNAAALGPEWHILQAFVRDGGLPSFAADSIPNENKALSSDVRFVLHEPGADAPQGVVERADGGQSWPAIFGMPLGESGWTESRHAITHVRVPITIQTVQIAVRSIQTYLPNLIELYCRLAQVEVDAAGRTLDPASLPVRYGGAESAWLTWPNESEWSPRELVPWIAFENDFPRWLGLES